MTGDTATSHYASIPELGEYVLIDSERPTVDCFRRGNGDDWILHRYRPGEDGRFQSLGFVLSLDALYESVRFPGSLGAS